MNTPMHCGDDTINALIDLEQAAKPNQNAGKTAIRYGADILMMFDAKVERWPTENRAIERLGELYESGYWVFAAPRGDAISYREWLHCGPAEHCGVEHVRVGRTQDDPGELVPVPEEHVDE